jgi:hypothetical protein
MSLKTDINLYEDYVLVDHSTWYALVHHFGGGAPEIMLQVIAKPVGKLEVPQEPEGFSVLCQKFEDTPDLNPIKLNLHYDSACENR